MNEFVLFVYWLLGANFTIEVVASSRRDFVSPGCIIFPFQIMFVRLLHLLLFCLIGLIGVSLLLLLLIIGHIRPTLFQRNLTFVHLIILEGCGKDHTVVLHKATPTIWRNILVLLKLNDVHHRVSTLLQRARPHRRRSILRKVLREIELFFVHHLRTHQKVMSGVLSAEFRICNETFRVLIVIDSSVW